MNETLAAMLASAALDKFSHRHKAELTFADACGFWRITVDDAPKLIDRRLALVRLALHDARSESRDGPIVLPGKRAIDAEQVGQLLELHEHLLERFGRHLTLLQSRR
jgi:hypothetical protein